MRSKANISLTSISFVNMYFLLQVTVTEHEKPAFRPTRGTRSRRQSSGALPSQVTLSHPWLLLPLEAAFEKNLKHA